MKGSEWKAGGLTVLWGHYFLVVKNIFFSNLYSLIFFFIDNISLDPDLNWAKILDQDPNSMYLDQCIWISVSDPEGPGFFRRSGSGLTVSKFNVFGCTTLVRCSSNKALSPEEQGDPQQHDDMLPVLALRQSHPLSQHIQHQYKEQQVILKTNSDLKKPARKTAKSTEKLEIQLPPNLDEKKSSSCLQSCEIFKIFI